MQGELGGWDSVEIVTDFSAVSGGVSGRVQLGGQQSCLRVQECNLNRLLSHVGGSRPVRLGSRL